MSRIERAMQLRADGRSCSQAVAEAFAPSFGVGAAIARGMARGFGSGLGQGVTCGAVTGAAMVIGLADPGTEDEGEDRQRVYARVRAFSERFAAERGALDCQDLLGGLDLTTTEGHDEAERLGLFDSVCMACVRTSAELLEEMVG